MDMRNSKNYIIPIDRSALDDIDDIITALIQTQALSFDTEEDIRCGALIAIMEYLLTGDWTGIEALLELSKGDLTEVEYTLLRGLMYRLTSVDHTQYPRLNDGVGALKDALRYKPDPIFITEVVLERLTNSMLVMISFEPT